MYFKMSISSYTTIRDMFLLTRISYIQNKKHFNLFITVFQKWLVDLHVDSVVT